MAAGTNETFLVSQGKDTRDVVTPYAFSVDESLIGLALASPIRRGMALLIDLTLVAMLTNVSSMFLAGLVAVMFFRAGNRLKQKKRFNGLRILLRALAAFLLFVFAFGLIDSTNDYGRRDADVSAISPQELGDAEGQSVASSQDVSAADALKFVGLTAKYIASATDISERIEQGQCSDAMICWEEMAIPLAEDLARVNMPLKETQGLFEAVLEQTQDSLTEPQVASLKQKMLNAYKALEPSSDVAEGTEPEGIKPQVADVSSDQQKNVIETINEVEPSFIESVTQSFENEEGNYSVIEWFKGIVTDLGIGFGWAAFYFTAFTAWLKGYTPGKRLFGIKAVKLDGKPMNLWESFERYGGYGAGLATGLLGFLQIFWDANRQAIHDKISETLVIDTRKPRVKVEVVSDVQSPQTVTSDVASTAG